MLELYESLAVRVSVQSFLLVDGQVLPVTLFLLEDRINVGSRLLPTDGRVRYIVTVGVVVRTVRT